MTPSIWGDGALGDARHRYSDLESGPLTLAGDLLLIMLDDATGRLRVRPRIASYALGGALLVEWWVAERDIPDRPRPWSRRVVVPGPLPSDDPVWTRGGLEWTVREWVESLATIAVDTVADWLVGAGWVRRERRMGLTGRREVLTPVRRNAAFWRPGRLATALTETPEEQVAGEDLTLAALLDAVGFAAQSVGSFRPWMDPGRLTRIRHILTQEYRPMAEVCENVQAIAARAAISQR